MTRACLRERVFEAEVEELRTKLGMNSLKLHTTFRPVSQGQVATVDDYDDDYDDDHEDVSRPPPPPPPPPRRAPR